jgi:phosphonate transport system permease protein
LASNSSFPTVLGLVGAGRIGLQLQASVNVLAWPQVTMIFVVVLATVPASEWLSARVRHAISRGSSGGPEG